MRKEEQPLAACGARPGADATAQGALALCPGERSAHQMFPVPAPRHSGHRPGAGGVSGAGRTCSWASFCSSLGEAGSFTRGQRQM